MPKYVYRRQGAQASQLTGFLLPGTTVSSVGPDAPPTYTTVDISDAASKSLLDNRMQTLGYFYQEQDPPVTQIVPQLVTVASAKLTANGSAITSSSFTKFSDGTNSLSLTVSSFGGSRLFVNPSMRAAILVGGSIRTVINGGSFSNTIVIEDFTLPVLADWRLAWGGYVDLPVTSSRTNYTVTVQARALGVLSSVTPSAGSNLVLMEVR